MDENISSQKEYFMIVVNGNSIKIPMKIENI